MGRIHSFESFGAVDGPGLRFVVFLQGCPLRCLYCHNPDSWAFDAGKEMSVGEVVSRILPFRSFYRNGGVTISGGEPMAQHDFVLELLQTLSREGLHTAVDTSGAIALSRCRDIIDQADMLLLDIKSSEAELSRRITGSSSVLQNEIDYLEHCEKTGKRVWIRHVAVPGLTLERGRLEELARLLAGYSCIERIEPLPFHKMGEHKWPDGAYTLGATPVPTDEEMSMVNLILKKQN